MKTILYIGILFEGSTAKTRMQDLINLGYNLKPVDISQIENLHCRISRSVAHRFHTGPLVSEINRRLEKITGNYDLLWIDKGIWINRETIELLKFKSATRFAIHFTPDAQFYQHHSKNFMDSLKGYDYLISTKIFEKEHYENTKIPFIFVKQGFSNKIIESINPPTLNREKLISFIGHSQQHYVNTLRRIAKEQIPHEIYGPGWKLKKYLNWKLNVINNGIWGDDYINTLKQSFASLGLLSKYIPETSTTRTFEIPAAGSLLIAERTWEHLSLYDENKEALFFDCLDELISHLKFVLKHPQIASKIAQNGNRRAISQNYDSRSQMKIAMKNIGHYL